jgi:hypothetical protein
VTQEFQPKSYHHVLRDVASTVAIVLKVSETAQPYADIDGARY